MVSAYAWQSFYHRRATDVAWIGKNANPPPRRAAPQVLGDQGLLGGWIWLGGWICWWPGLLVARFTRDQVCWWPGLLV